MSQHTPAATAPILVIDLQTGMLDGVAEPPLHGSDGLIERAQQIERLISERLLRLQAGDDRIGDVRGRGAMIAIELVKSGTSDPDAELTQQLATAAHAAGVIVLTCGMFGNVIRLLPPLTISDELLTEGLDVLAGLLAEL